MGNIASVFFSVSIDYITGSLVAMTGEKIFGLFDATKKKYLMVAEGLTQLTFSVIAADWLSSLLTPAGSGTTDMLGMVAIMSFIFLYSPNMKARLTATHATTKQVIGMN